MIPEHSLLDCFTVGEPVQTLGYSDKRQPTIWKDDVSYSHPCSNLCMSPSHWFCALGFNSDFRDTGSSPPESGNWTISTNTACSGSRVRLSDGASLVVSGGDLTLTGGSLYLNGSIQFSSGKGLVLNESIADLTQSTYAYDGNGNLLFDGEFGYVYNDVNQLYEVREGGTSGEVVARYFYNHEGRRIKKVEYNEGEISNVTYYVGRDFELQNYSGTTYNVTYYMANGELVGRKDNDGSRFYYHNDHLGGTHVVTNSSGGVVERTRYYPYGKLLKGGESKYTYTGQEDDKESNLMYYGARYYHPEIRRFIQPDPIIQDYYNPQVLNRYSYVNNNPLKYVDPSGNVLFVPPIIWGFSIMAAGFGGYIHYVATSESVEQINERGMVEFVKSGTKPALYLFTFGYLRGLPFKQQLDIATGTAFLKISQNGFDTREHVIQNANILLEEVGPVVLSNKGLDKVYKNLPPEVRVKLLENADFVKLVADIGAEGVDKITEEKREKIVEFISTELDEYEKTQKNREDTRDDGNN